MLGADPADSSSFFEDLASQIPQSPTAKGPSPAPSPRGPAPGGLHADEADAQPGTAEANIMRALYAANYSAAVDACIQVSATGPICHGLKHVICSSCHDL